METEREVDDTATKAEHNVQGLAPALKESRKRNHRTIVEVNTDTVLISCGIDKLAGLRSARAQGDDMGRALWPLDARYKTLRGRGRDVGTCAMFAAAVRGYRRRPAHNRGEGFDGVNRVNWLSGVLIYYESV